MADNAQGVPEDVIVGSGDGMPEFKMPSTEQLLASIEKMTGLSEEQKKELLDGILARQQDGGFPGMGAPPPHEPPIGKSVSLEIVWVVTLLSLVFLVLDNPASITELIWAAVASSHIFSGMIRSKALASLEILAGIVSNRSARKNILGKIEAGLVRERIKNFCAVFYGILAVLFVGCFVFFGYKLYKSLVDRERRREEKRRQKLQKKKK